MKWHQLHIPTLITVIVCFCSNSLSPPAHAVEEKIYFLVSLQTLSNHDRELNKEGGPVCTRTQRTPITAAHSCSDVETMEGIVNCNTDRKLAEMTLSVFCLCCRVRALRDRHTVEPWAAGCVRWSRRRRRPVQGRFTPPWRDHRWRPRWAWLIPTATWTSSSAKMVRIFNNPFKSDTR